MTCSIFNATLKNVISRNMNRPNELNNTLLHGADFVSGSRRIIALVTRTMATQSKSSKCLSLDNLNPNVLQMEYAVRGPIVIRATEIEKELQKGVTKPFTRVIKANIGDAHAMGQVPITFIRQVLALITFPELLKDASFPNDAKKRAKAILDACKGSSVGSYTESAGIELIRRHCAQYIERRDGFPSDWKNIILSSGASDAIKSVLKLFVKEESGKKSGIMIPIPQYPLYSACIAEFGMHQIGYYLDEANNWALNISELERAFKEAQNMCNPRALVVINPGNPTGQVLSKQNIQDIIKFANKNNLFVFADEVYQDNIYATNKEFHSFKKVSCEMGSPYSDMEMASFMSCSKGYMGECGIRGGYAEIVNLSPDVMAMLLKSISAMLCPTSLGQSCMDVVVNPPKPGEESYEKFISEKQAVLQSLAVRSKMVYEAFRAMDGFSCNINEGAMYSFPQVKLPPKAIEAAKAKCMHPDVFYAFELLENTGICVVPGSGFGQMPGTYHFRTTILPQPDMLREMLCKFDAFHSEFLKKYK